MTDDGNVPRHDERFNQASHFHHLVMENNHSSSDKAVPLRRDSSATMSVWPYQLQQHHSSLTYGAQ